MNPDAMITTLKSMKLHGMADAIGELAEQASPAYQQAIPVLEMLLKAESSEREVRSINYQMKIARFPAHRDLAGFNFAESSVSAGQVKALHRCEFLDETENVVLCSSRLSQTSSTPFESASSPGSPAGRDNPASAKNCF